MKRRTGEQAYYAGHCVTTAAEAKSHSISIQKGHTIFGPERRVIGLTWRSMYDCANNSQET